VRVKPDDSATRLAGLSLIALRQTALNASPLVTRYILLPNRGPRDSRIVIEAIASLNKPALCASFQEGSVLFLGCWPAEEMPTRGLEEAQRSAAALFDMGLRPRYGQQGEFNIVARDSHSTVTVSGADFQRWLYEYIIDSMSWTFRELDRPPNGRVTVLVEFSRSISTGEPPRAGSAPT
jgi:hypothetical protein